ncbi:MAG TPA: aminotransferase class I/II-fold pyridoxal phosphate-dependent enzyme [Burkholderiales bacterium]
MSEAQPDLPLALGSVREALSRRGLRALDEVATGVEAALARLAAIHPWAFHLHVQRGADATARVVAASGAERECILWTHNIYLGLNREPRVIERTLRALETYGTGAGASPPVGGLTGLHDALARRLAQMLGKESALLFSTGYAANLSALSALPARGDLVLLDRESHASMLQGAALSGARWMVFRHNDLADLEQMLAREAGRHPNVYVAVESAYSMSGDLCPLVELVALKRRYGFRLYVDEAHTFGFYGTKGRGYCEEQGVLDEVDFITSTFSKATAALGGFVAGKASHCTLLALSARSYLAQACFPPALAATVLAALDEIETNPALAATLHANNRYMRRRLTDAGFDLGTSRSPIIPIRVADVATLYELAARLAQDGVFAQPITEPGVSPGESRLRFVVTARHTRAQIDITVDALVRHARALGLLPEARHAV